MNTSPSASARSDEGQNRLQQLLRDLVARHWTRMPGSQWISAGDRWNELVFCILNELTGDPIKSRQMVEALNCVGLIEPSRLVEAEAPSTQARAAGRYALLHRGLTEEQADRALAILSHVAVATQSRFDGSIQSYLRTKAASIRDELTATYAGAGLSNAEMRRAVAQWLQTAVGLPLSSEHEGVGRFCEERGIDFGELERAADEIGLDLAVVDDLIRYEHASKDADDTIHRDRDERSLRRA